MKKILAWTLALTMGLSLCACGENTSSSEPSDAAAESAVSETAAETTAAAEDENTEETENTADSDTVEIATAEELVDFAKSVTDGSIGGAAGKTVLLTADIDCSDVEWTPIGTMDLDDMSNYSCMFQGVFDGQGHTISNVTFESDYPICGAGIIGMNLGEVKNLTAENIQIHCTDTYSMAIGGVVGYNMGEIHDVTLTGENEIAGVNATGGITGGSTKHVYNCNVDGTTIKVLGDNDFSDGRIVQCDIAECGGLIIGGSFGGTMENCNAKGKIIAEGNEPVGLGGIAGCLQAESLQIMQLTHPADTLHPAPGVR